MQFNLKGLPVTAFVILSLTFFVSAAPGPSPAIYPGGSGPVKLPTASLWSNGGSGNLKRDPIDFVDHDHNDHAVREHYPQGYAPRLLGDRGDDALNGRNLESGHNYEQNGANNHDKRSRYTGVHKVREYAARLWCESPTSSCQRRSVGDRDPKVYNTHGSPSNLARVIPNGSFVERSKPDDHDSPAHHKRDNGKPDDHDSPAHHKRENGKPDDHDSPAYSKRESSGPGDRDSSAHHKRENGMPDDYDSDHHKRENEKPDGQDLPAHHRTRQNSDHTWSHQYSA